MADRFLTRLLWLSVAAAALMLLWRALPQVESWFAPKDSTPRTVAARGDLAADEHMKH